MEDPGNQGSREPRILILLHSCVGKAPGACGSGGRVRGCSGGGRGKGTGGGADSRTATCGGGGGRLLGRERGGVGMQLGV